MFAQVTRLQYWKSEHDEQTCEDAYGACTGDGLFAVADGAGTTLFSNIWAKILAQSFLAVPLMSNHPFEVEWWVRRAQEIYKQETPDPGTMVWNALQKAQSQGSHSTLVTLRITQSDATRAEAELLAFGDSCVLIYKPLSEQILTFPLDKPTDFERAPICVPSKRGIFNRYFHQCHIKHIELAPGNVIALATDAVAKWVISAAGGRHAQAKDAFQELMAQTPTSWAAFIDECRSRGEMIDDDSTALLISLTTNETPNTVPLGATTIHSQSIREGRNQELTSAMASNNKELVAIAYGDGSDLNLEGVTMPAEQIQQARRVADAQREVLQMLRQVVNQPDAATKMAPVWQQYADLLRDEPCAVHVRQTLTRLGIAVAPPALPQSAPPVEKPTDEIVPSIPQQSAPPVEKVIPPAPSQPAPPVEKPTDEAELAKQHEARERSVLEIRFAHALRKDDDKAIIAAHNAIQQSHYTGSITIFPPEEQRIKLAYQRETQRQGTQIALQSTPVEQVASTPTNQPTEHGLRQKAAANEKQLSWFARLINFLLGRKGAPHA